MKKIKLCQKCAQRTGISEYIPEVSECQVCAGLLYNLEPLAKELWQEFKNFEFNTFQTGIQLKEETKEIEKELVKETTQSLRYQFNKEFNKVFSRISKKKVDYEDPDIFFLYYQKTNSFSSQIRPLYIYGRYRKLVRGIPQTRWDCKACRGNGCQKCKYQGKIYPESVEELIGKPFLKMTKGTTVLLHGAGREDIDVRMLGNGRPFILEIKKPKVRSLNLKNIEKEINQRNKGKVEILDLRFTNQAMISFLKEAKFQKVYLVKISSSRKIDCQKLKQVLRSLENKKISQLTPTRVAHRRPNLVRERKVIRANLISCNQNEAQVEIETEAGLYIKELINGDQGRTKPNLSDLTNTPLEVIELDVIQIREK